MTWNHARTPHIWPMLFSAAFSTALVVHTRWHRNVPSATAFALHESFLSLWAFFTAISMAATWPTKVLGHKLEVSLPLGG